MESIKDEMNRILAGRQYEEVAYIYERKVKVAIKLPLGKSKKKVKEELFLKQGKNCAICKSLLLNANSASLDHCHRTGKIRQLLCKSCNFGLGWFGDNIQAVRFAAEYLEKHEKQ